MDTLIGQDWGSQGVLSESLQSLLPQYLESRLPMTVIVLVIGCGLVYSIRYFASSSCDQRAHPSKNVYKLHGRSPGTWGPVSFQRPIAKPYPDWDVKTTKPLPYRPFKYGPYNITMGLRRMNWDEWVELDNHYMTYHKRKADRIIERGAMLTKISPEAYDGAYELLEELCDYLPQRYPTLFHRTPVGIDNLHTKESFNLAERPMKENPLQIAARLIQDDIVLMFEKPDGQYYFLAGSVILPGAWRLKDKFGMPLSEIHTSGNVPGYKAKLEKSMMNLFRRIQPDSPMLRHNYFFQLDDDVAWNHSLGAENFDEVESYDKTAPTTVKHHWASADKNDTIERVWFRTERQSMRRLPKSGAIAFVFRTYFHPVVEIAEEPGVPGRLASAVRSWDDDTALYKGREKYQDVLLEYLDMKHKEQVEKGLIDEVIEKDKRSYPY